MSESLSKSLSAAETALSIAMVDAMEAVEKMHDSIVAMASAHGRLQELIARLEIE